MPIQISCTQLRLPTMESSLSLSNSTFLPFVKDYRPHISSSFSSKLSINNYPKFTIKSQSSLPPPQPYSRSTITATPSTTAVTISSFAAPYTTATTTSSTPSSIDQIIPFYGQSILTFEEFKKRDSFIHSMDLDCFTNIIHFLSPHKHHRSSDLPSLPIVKLKKTISPKKSFNTLSSLSRPPQYSRSTFTLRCVATSSATATATATTTSSTPSATAKTFQGLCYVVGDNIGTDKLGSDSLIGLPSSGRTPFVETGEFKSKYCVIIAGQNFGYGSSGEHATRALEAAGIHAVVAESYAGTYVSNTVDTAKVHRLESVMRIRDENRTGDVVAIELGVGESLLINRTTGKEYRLKHSAGDAKSVTEAGVISKTMAKTRLEIFVFGKNVFYLRVEGEKVLMGKTAEKAS